jgi:hypothetical protein
MLGVSPVLARSLYLAIGVAALSLLLIAFGQLRTGSELIAVRDQLAVIAERAAGQIVELHSHAKRSELVPPAGTNITLAEMKLAAPDRVAGKTYELELSQRMLSATATTSATAKVQVNRTVGTDLVLLGKARPPASLHLIRSNLAGVIVDLIVLG